MPIRYFANAPATTLTASVAAGTLILPVASNAGLPIQYPYTLILDRGTASEEAVSVTAGSGLSLTITRAIDGTTAFTHTLGATVEHGITAQDIRDANSHIFDTSSTSAHTKGQVGLGNVDNTSDINKPVSTAQAASIATKLDASTSAVDAAVVSRVNDVASSTRAALSGTYARVVRATGMTGGTDCTTALTNFFSDAQSAKVPLVIPASANGLAYKCSAILSAWDGAEIVGENNPVIDFQTDHSATGRGLFIGSAVATPAQGVANITKVTVRGLTLISSNATARNGAYALVALFNAHDVVLQDVTIGDLTVAHSGGESAGIFTQNSHRIKLVRCRVFKTYADGIHVSRGSKDVVIDHALVVGAEDDGVAVVSVMQDGVGPIYDPCSRVQINQPIVHDSVTLGSGISLVGAQDCTVSNPNIYNVPASAIIVQQANYGGIINPARNSVVGGFGRNLTNASVGGVHIANATLTTISGFTLTDSYNGILALSCDRTVVSGVNVDTNSAGGIGVYEDPGSTRTNVTGSILNSNSGGAYLFQGTGVQSGNVTV